MDNNVENITIAVMGATGAGKSTFVNLVSQSNLEVSDGLESCTQNVHIGNPFMLDGKMVTLIDTPGFDDSHRDEAEILRLIADFLAVTYREGRKLNGVIYLYRISDARMGGVAQKNFRLFRRVCGENTLKNVVIVTTMWDTTPREAAERRERDLVQNMLFFKPAIDRGAQMRRHNNTIESAHRILRTIIGFPPEILRIQQETVDENKTLVQTDAGRELNAELARVEARYREEISRLRAEYEEAAARRDTQHADEVRELSSQLSDSREALQKVEREKRGLAEENESQRAASEERLRRVWQEVTRREEDLRRLVGERDTYHDQAEEARRTAAEEARRRNLVEKALEDARANARPAYSATNNAGRGQPGAQSGNGGLGAALLVAAGIALSILFRRR